MSIEEVYLVQEGWSVEFKEMQKGQCGTYLNMFFFVLTQNLTYSNLELKNELSKHPFENGKASPPLLIADMSLFFVGSLSKWTSYFRKLDSASTTTLLTVPFLRALVIQTG